MNLYPVLAGVYGFAGAFLEVAGIMKFSKKFRFLINENLKFENLMLSYIDARGLIELLSFCLIGTGFLIGIAAAFYPVAINPYGSLSDVLITLFIFYYIGFSVTADPPSVAKGKAFARVNGVWIIVLIFILPMIVPILGGQISIEPHVIVIGTNIFSLIFDFPWFTLLFYTFKLR